MLLSTFQQVLQQSKMLLWRLDWEKGRDTTKGNEVTILFTMTFILQLRKEGEGDIS